MMAVLRYWQPRDLFLFPNIPHSHPFAITKQTVHPQVNAIELGKIPYMPPDKVVKPGVWFVEHADPDAIGAITLIANPELKALFKYFRT
jgi:hypothetical protein